LIKKGKFSVLLLGLAAISSLVKGVSAAYLLSLKEFGNYSVIMSFVIFSVLLFSFAVEPRYLRSGSRILSFSNNGSAFDAHFLRYSTGLVLNFSFSLFPMSIVMYLFELPAQTVLLVFISSFISSQFNLSIASLRLIGNYFSYSLIVLCRSLSVICLYFLVPDDFKEANVFILLDVIVCFFCYIYINLSRFKIARCKIINFGLYKGIVKAGWGYSSSYIARTGLMMIDRPVVALVQGSISVGLFSIYLIPTQVAIGLLGLVSVYLQPWGLACSNSGRIKEIKVFIQNYLVFSAAFCALVLVCFFAFFDLLQSQISYDLKKQELMLSIFISLLILFNVFDTFYLVLGKGREQFILSSAIAVGYCSSLLVYYFFQLDYLFLLWSLFVLRVVALVYGFVYINSVLNKKMEVF
jgi:hypothetical protein